MSGTAKTVLIVGAAAAGAFLLLRALAPRPVASPGGALPGGVTLRGIVDAGFGVATGLRDFFSSSSTTPDEIEGVPTADFQAGHFGVDYSS